MKKLIPLLLLLSVLLSLDSCYVTRTTVGDGPVGKTTGAVTYSHKKQMYVLWGGLTLNPANQPAIPQGCGFQVRSSFNFIDILVTSLTGGIFGMRTVKILVQNGGPCDPAILKAQQKEQREIRKIKEKNRKRN